MSVYFKAVQRRNFKEPGKPKKWYAICKSLRQVTIEEMSSIISASTTFTPGDMLGVIQSFLEETARQLSFGNRVSLGALGNLHLTLRTRAGVDEKDLLAKSDIKNAHVVFNAGKQLRNMCKTLDYKPATAIFGKDEEGGAEENSEEVGA